MVMYINDITTIHHHHSSPLPITLSITS